MATRAVVAEKYSLSTAGLAFLSVACTSCTPHSWDRQQTLLVTTLHLGGFVFPLLPLEVSIYSVYLCIDMPVVCSLVLEYLSASLISVFSTIQMQNQSQLLTDCYFMHLQSDHDDCTYSTCGCVV